MFACDFDTPGLGTWLGLYNSIVYIHERFASDNVKAILHST